MSRNDCNLNTSATIGQIYTVLDIFKGNDDYLCDCGGEALAAGRLQMVEHHITPLLLLHLHSPCWWLFKLKPG